jgi:hypothetical protein
MDLSNVQDGTGTDDQTLSIDSTANSYTMTIEGGNSVSWTKGGGSGFWTRDVANSEIYPTNLNDDVGIGTANPTADLHIASAIPQIVLQDLNTASPSNTGYIRFNDSSNSIVSYIAKLSDHLRIDGGYNDVGIYTSANITPMLFVDESERKIGILNDTPANELDVNGTIETDDLKIDDPTAAAGYVWTATDADGNGEWQDLELTIDSTDIRFPPISGDIVGERFTISNGNNDVTFDVDKPATLSTITNTAGTTWEFENSIGGIIGTIDVADNDNDDKNEIELPAGGSNGDVLSTNGFGVYSWVAQSGGADGNGIYDGSGSLSGNVDVTMGSNDLNFDSNTLFIDGSADRVGIGTATPTARLHIKSEAAGTDPLLLENSANSNPIMKIGEGGAGHGNLQFYDLNGTERIRLASVADGFINTTGNFGIGTTSPSATLDVDGTLEVTEEITWGRSAIGSMHSIGVGGSLTSDSDGTPDLINFTGSNVSGAITANISTSNEKLTVTNAGTYTISFSSRLKCTSNGDDVEVYITIDGTQAVSKPVLYHGSGTEYYSYSDLFTVDLTAGQEIQMYIHSITGATCTADEPYLEVKKTF